MGLPSPSNQLKLIAERLTETSSLIARDRQSTAPFWAIQRERRDDGVSAGLQGALLSINVGRTVLFLGKEMERRPVVPDVVCLGRFPRRRVRHNPAELCSLIAEPSLRGRQCGFRQVEYGDRSKTHADEAVDQA